MALVKGDEFQVPISGQDNTAKAFKSIQMGLKKLKDNYVAASVAINQSWEIVGKVTNKLDKIYGSTIGKSIALEKAVAEVTTLLGGDASNAARQLTNEILQLQEQFGGDQQDLAKAYYQAISSGAVNAETAQTLLTTAQKLAVGGVTDLTTATDGLTTILNAYGLSAERSSEVSDVLFLGMKAGKTTIGQLSQSLGAVASIASATGVSFDELVASVSAVTTGGVETNVAVTQVRSAIVGLSKQTPQLSAVLKKLGVDSIQAKVSQDGLVGTLKEIIAQTDGSSESLIELFGRIEAVNAVTALTSDAIGGSFNKTLEEMKVASQDTGKVSEEAFSKLASTVDFQMKVASAQIEANLTRIGQNIQVVFLGVMNVFKTVTSGLINSIEFVTRLFNQINLDSLRQKFNTLAISIGIVGTALAVAFRASLFANIQGLIGLITTLGSKFLIAAAPVAIIAAKVTLITAAIVGAIAAVDILIKNIKNIGFIWDKIVAEILLGFETIKLASLIASNSLKAALGQDVDTDAIGKTIKKIDDLKKKSEETGKVLKENFDLGVIGNVIKDLVTDVNDLGNETKDASKAAANLKKNLQAVADTKIPALTQEQEAGLQRLSQMTNNFTMQRLESENKFVAATKIRNQLALEAFNKEFEELEKSLAGREKELELIQKARDALIEKGKADVVKATEKEAKAVKEISTGSQVIGFDQGQIKQLRTVMGDGAANFADAIGGAGISAAIPMLGAVDMVANVIQGMIDFFPGLINKIANIFSSLTDLPNQILDSIVNLISSIDTFLSSFLSNLVSAIPKVLNAIFLELPKIISDGVMSLLNSLPVLVSSLIDMLPLFISEFIRSIPAIAIKLIEFFIKDAPKIAIALSRALIVDLPIALAEGVVNGIQQALGLVGDAIKGIFPTDEIKKGVAEIGDKISRSSSQLFKVVDLEAASRGLDVADKIRNAINSSTTKTKNILARAWDFLKKVWDKIFSWFQKLFGPIIDKAWDVVVKVFKHLKETVEGAFEVVVSIFEGLKDIVIDAWETIVNFFKLIFKGKIKEAFASILAFFQRSFKTIWEKAFKPIVNYFTNVFKSAWENAFKPIVTFFTTVFQTVWDTATAPFRNLFNNIEGIFMVVVDHFKNAFSAVGDYILAPFNMIMDFFKNVFEGNITGAFESVFQFFRDIPKNLLTALDALNPANLFKKLFNTEGASGQGSIESAIGKIISGFDVPFVKFAEGGEVPGKSIVPGNSETNDIVPALLSPGEIVLSRSQVKMFKEIFPDTQNLFGGNIVKAVKKAGGQVSDVTKKIVNTLNPMEILEKYKDNVTDKLFSMIENMFINGAGGAVTSATSQPVNELQSQLGTLKLVKGGRVDIPDGIVRNRVINAQSGGMIGENNATDTIKTNLTPGEFVVNREAANNNLGLLNKINDTKRPVSTGSNVINLNVVINSKTMLTADQIKKEVVPTLEKELKRKSQQGRFVIDRAGIRS